MYSYASRILSIVVDPVTLTLLVLLYVLFIRKRWPRVFLGAYVTAFVILLFFSSSITSDWLVSSLESQYPDKDVAAEPAAQAIVVLGGTLRMPSDLHHASGITNTSDRLLVALRLYRAGKAPLVVLSGGDSPLLEKARKQHEADEMRALLEEWGVPDSAILVEDGSTNTHENALYTHQLLQQRGIKRILLVTSATHMPRAAATFRKQGFDVVAAPADFLSGWEQELSIFKWFPSTGALVDSNEAIHEWVGLWVYRLHGWL